MIPSRPLVFLCLVACLAEANSDRTNEQAIYVVTVANEWTDGFTRYKHSLENFGIEPIILGYNLPWLGGNIRHGRGGGWKVNLFKQFLEPLKMRNTTIVLFTDAYDVIFCGSLNSIYNRFIQINSRILFGSEKFCWPDTNLSNMYPKIDSGNHYLNSGLIIGYADSLWNLLNVKQIQNLEDDQLYYTECFLDARLRGVLNITLDYNNTIFQNLAGAASDIELHAVSDISGVHYDIHNVVTHSQPLIIHGNGPSKLYLNYIGNYVPNAWNSKRDCIKCQLDQLLLEGKNDDDMPTVFLALFVEIPTPFLEEQLDKIAQLNYPKQRMRIFIHNAVQHHSNSVVRYVLNHLKEYMSLEDIKPEAGIDERFARELSLEKWMNYSSDFYLSVDSIAHMDNPQTLRMLVEQNRTVVAPLLTRVGKPWSNFWGAISESGFYARSADYLDIVQNLKRGLWNVPFVAHCYLINGSTFFRTKDKRSILSYTFEDLDPDMAFCTNLRNEQIFMYVSNRVDFGHLVNPGTFDIKLTEPEMYELFTNENDWEERFIHKEYWKVLKEHHSPEQPCPDVFRFPLTTPLFCTSLINMMESYGQWSNGSNKDERLQGGYEAVPTRDIHMKQVGWETHWLEILKRYIRPLQEQVFIGYFHDPPISVMNFVVRYKPDEQPRLRPHHDSSTYTTNLALNEGGGVDYEGGGCRFLRYNCSVINTKPGWLLMHPGRLTHYHEGLPVTKGTRYILVSFIDP